MLCSLKTFLRQETGAVSVEWILMTAVTAFLGLGVLPSVEAGINGQGDNIQTAMADMDVGPKVGNGLDLEIIENNQGPAPCAMNPEDTNSCAP